jgi:cytosine/adenosine deaminase-related metal-dependent hydrolase
MPICSTLKTLYPIWARMNPEDIRISTQTALAELALSGCTTASDHLYLFPTAPNWMMKLKLRPQ